MGARMLKVCCLAAVCVFVTFSVSQASDVTRPTIMGTQGMVSCGHWLAADAAVSILKRGGSSVKAGLNANPGIPAAVIRELEARGHRVTVLKAQFTDATTMIVYDAATGVMSGGASPARD